MTNSFPKRSIHLLTSVAMLGLAGFASGEATEGFATERFEAACSQPCSIVAGPACGTVPFAALEAAYSAFSVSDLISLKCTPPTGEVIIIR